MFIGFNMTFLVQHWMGVEGMPRRIANYPGLPGQRDHAERDLDRRLVDPRPVRAHVPLERVHDLAVRREGDRGRPVGFRQLAGVGDLLPAAAAQLHRIPRISSERPAFELHYPHIKCRDGRISSDARGARNDATADCSTGPARATVGERRSASTP